MSNQPPYIGPFSAETYDKMYGYGALFTPPQAPDEMPEEPRTFADRLDPTGWRRMDGLIFLAVVLLLAGIVYLIIKKLK